MHRVAGGPGLLVTLGCRDCGTMGHSKQVRARKECARLVETTVRDARAGTERNGVREIQNVHLLLNGLSECLS